MLKLAGLHSKLGGSCACLTAYLCRSATRLGHAANANSNELESATFTDASSIGRLSVMLARVGSLSMQTLKTTLYRPGLSTLLAKGRRAGSSTISNCGFSMRNLRSPASPLGF